MTTKKHHRREQRPKRHPHRPPNEAKQPQAIVLDAIGLATLKRNEQGIITEASSATFEAGTNGSILVLRSPGQAPMVIGWGFIEALVDAVGRRYGTVDVSKRLAALEAHVSRGGLWRRFWRWLRRAG